MPRDNSSVHREREGASVKLLQLSEFALEGAGECGRKLLKSWEIIESRDSVAMGYVFVRLNSPLFSGKSFFRLL